jgi:hypothetical protein
MSGARRDRGSGIGGPVRVTLELRRWALGAGRWQEQAARAAACSGYRPRTTDHARRAARLSLCAALVALSGCSSFEPWVKPYERAAFADPIMAFDPNPVSSAYTHHVYEAREGARGASGSSGGGCGCN